MRAASLTLGAGRSAWGTLLLLLLMPLLTSSMAAGQCNGGNGGGGNGGGGNGGSSNPPAPSTPADPAVPPSPTTYGGPADAATPSDPATASPPSSTPPTPPAPGLDLVPEGVTAAPRGVESHDWRAWWSRHQDRYFQLASERDREFFAATDAALAVSAMGAGLAGEWGLGNYVDRLPRTETLLRARLGESSAQADAALQALARLQLPISAREFEARFQANSTSRWSALLALGLRGEQDDIIALKDQLLGAQASRDQMDRVAAAHALGLVGAAHSERTQRLEALRTLGAAALELKLPPSIHLATVEALGVAARGIDSTAERAYAMQLAEQLLPLMRERQLSREARAALPVSLARLVGTHPMARSARAELTSLCVAQVQERSAGIAEQYGAVQALGQLIVAQEGDVDQRLLLLSEIADNSRQRALRPAAMMALAQSIGRLGWNHPSVERHATKTLIKILRNGTAQAPRWASLALGVAAAEAEAAGHGIYPAEVRKVLMREHLGANANDLRTTTALALGLAADMEAHELVLDHALDRNSRQDLAESVDALALYGNPANQRPLLKFAKRKRLEPGVERSLARALATADAAEARVALYEDLGDLSPEVAAARCSTARYFPMPDLFDSLGQGVIAKRVDTATAVAAMRALGRMQEARPGVLRGACLQDRNPYVPSPFEAWMAEL